MPNMKRALANVLHASDMLSFRILHCGSDVSVQNPPKFARVLGVRGRVPQVCCEMLFVEILFQRWWVGLLDWDARSPPMSLCARKARFSENNHVPSKISGHENG